MSPSTTTLSTEKDSCNSLGILLRMLSLMAKDERLVGVKITLCYNSVDWKGSGIQFTSTNA